MTQHLKLRNSSLSDDILKTLIDKEEAAWVCDQRSRPLAILSRLRRLIHAEYASGVCSACSRVCF